MNIENSRHKYLILFILLLALTLRGVYLVQTRSNPLFKPVDTGLDPSLYHHRAVLISQGVHLAPDFIYGMPLYPYFLALIYKIFGQNILVVRLIQMLMGASSCLLIYLISKRIFNRRAALISMFLCATYGMFVFYEGMLLGAALTILLSCLIILTLLSLANQTSYRKWLLLGLLVGIAGLNWASIFLSIPFILFWFNLTNRESLKKKLLYQLIFCVTLACMVAPVTFRNYLIAKDFIPLTAHSGINFYIGNNPKADGSFKAPEGMHISIAGLIVDSTTLAQRATGRQMKPSEVSEFWVGQSMHFIRTQPLSYLRLLLRKVALLVNSYEIYDVVDYSFFRKGFSTILNLPLPSLRFVMPLALLGIALSLKEWRKRLLLYLFCASFIISILAYFVHARYRLPLVPFLIIFSAYTLDWWIAKIQEKDFKAVGLSVAGFLLFFIAANQKIIHQDHASQYNNLGVAYKETGELDLAIEAYENALEINPNLAYTRSNLGNLYNIQGRYVLAIKEFERALELDPDLAEAHVNLGLAYEKTGRRNLAINEYKRALELRPDLFSIHYDLGVLYAKQNLFAQAKAEWQKALAINPQHTPSQEALKKLKRLNY